MITTRQQLEDWIKDNGITRWKFFVNDPSARQEGERTNDCIADSMYYPESIDEKIALTAKQLESHGNRAYGVGFHGEKGTTGGMTTVAQLQPATTTMQQTIGVVPMAAPAVDREELAKSIRKEIMGEIREQSYADRMKKLEAAEAEFQREKEGAMGLLVGYLKPVLSALAGGGSRVAGLDTAQPIYAQPIQPKAEPETQQPDEEESVFTDEEAEELELLLARFKAVEPEYMTMLRKVVTMAEAGDATYTMAKNFLCK